MYWVFWWSQCAAKLENHHLRWCYFCVLFIRWNLHGSEVSNSPFNLLHQSLNQVIQFWWKDSKLSYSMVRQSDQPGSWSFRDGIRWRLFSHTQLWSVPALTFLPFITINVLLIQMVASLKVPWFGDWKRHPSQPSSGLLSSGVCLMLVSGSLFELWQIKHLPRILLPNPYFLGDKQHKMF